MNSGNAIGDGRESHGGARPNSGPFALHDRIPADKLEAACVLIRTGRATVEAAVLSYWVTTHSSISRSKIAGEKAAEKLESGGELTESEFAALRFYTSLSGAVAAREIILTRQALGDGMVLIGEIEDPETGQIVKQYASPKQAEQALKILQLTCKHWMPKSHVETEHSGNLVVTSETIAERENKLAALKEALAAAETDGEE